MNQALTYIHLTEIQDELTITVPAYNRAYILIYGFCDGIKKLRVNVAHEGAYACILGMIIGLRGTCGISTFQNHSAPHTTSDLLVKTILLDNAAFNYEGTIRIEKAAQGSNAYQRNENIMISPSARVTTRPYLEILANDVRCTHGATVGTFGEEEYFYLGSRGIAQRQATLLLAQGFLQSIIQKIPEELITDRMKTIIKEQLAVFQYAP
ncbi:MAG: SufD family Fe-S cluster assembly protein [Patescibacteria group bacterium]